MGVINVTPDSFSDGGQFDDAAQAIAPGRRLAAEGASIVDVGGESTRPGADPVPAADELARVVPVVAGLGDVAQGSIDTMKLDVARAAVGAGGAPRKRGPPLPPQPAPPGVPGPPGPGSAPAPTPPRARG